jgi:hypothetical protein
MNTKEAGQTVLKFGAGAAGLTVGSIGLKFVNSKLPDSVPDLAKKIIPGLAAMGAAYVLSAKVDNDKVKSIAFGLGLAGFADVLKRTLGDKIALINDNVPSLSGTPQATMNTGDYPPSYYFRNAFQGVPMNGADAFSLSGVPMNGLRGLRGAGAYALSGGGKSGYALS